MYVGVRSNIVVRCRTTQYVGIRFARWFIFKPKIPIWVIFEGLRLKNADIFYGHLEYLGTFGKLYDHLVHFVLIWYIFPVKSGNPGRN
jgi:hypothetical protein